ncbi:MAG: hypothetical protein WC869_15855 [Phycisphaerae bacterium]|jgi:hypothetical protein
MRPPGDAVPAQDEQLTGFQEFLRRQQEGLGGDIIEEISQAPPPVSEPAVAAINQKSAQRPAIAVSPPSSAPANQRSAERPAIQNLPPGAGGNGQRSGQRPAIQPPAQAPAAAGKACGGCNRQIPIFTAVCPFCGFDFAKHAAALPSDADGLAPRPAPVYGTYFKLCRAALAHPGGNAGSVAVAALALTLGYACCRLLYVIFPDFLPSLPGGKMLLLGATLLMLVLVVGYCLQVVIRLISSSVAGATRLVSGHHFRLWDILKTGLMGLAIGVIYLAPVVTLPLLPLVLLAFSMAQNGRSFNIARMLKWALACGEMFAILWLVLFLAAVGLVVEVMLLNALFAYLSGLAVAPLAGTEGTILTELIGIGRVLVTSLITCALACGPIRCIGLMGRFRPDLVGSLVGKDNAKVTWSIVAGSFLLTAVLVAAIFM